ncbi:MAG TPA: M13 family metallopeptidase N-terminal domain-containing protein, partial [Pyrinomonadaceae bacterium]|nr:M13 family metallopeptidase N-terminal domain-containing protein [Pyrinomonadaceae bacterium]
MRFTTCRLFQTLMFFSLLALVCVALQLSPQVSAQSTRRGIDPANMCNACNACEDFYMYANGGWLAKNEIPAAFSTWGTTSSLREKNIGVLRQILEEAAKNTAAPKDSLEQKTGAFYASCMDEPRIEAAGAKPIAAEQAAINKMKSVKELPATVGRLHDLSVRTLFSFGAVQDFKDSSVVNARVGQGGLGLPDRDFYFKEDEKSQTIRDAYVTHVANMFKLLGDDAAKADTEAQVVMKIETELAKNSLDRVARRDLSKQYNKMTVTELQTVTPDFNWNAYLKALNAPKFTDVNMAHPVFFKGLNAMLGT